MDLTLQYETTFEGQLQGVSGEKVTVSEYGLLCVLCRLENTRSNDANINDKSENENNFITTTRSLDKLDEDLSQISVVFIDFSARSIVLSGFSTATSSRL
ncbi:hypothetical protein BBP40_006854 [Aspergillus hancockii]|nr:hypothetical protein BBP40_006854 [Aspergillus hancockii]